MSELFPESGNEHLSLDEHLGGGHPKGDGVFDTGFLGVGEAGDRGGIQMSCDVSHLVWSSLVHLAVDVGNLGPVVSDSFLWLLVKVPEVGTNGFGRKLRLVVSQEGNLDVVELLEVDAGEVLEGIVPLLGVISQEIGELIDFAFIGGPLSNPGGFLETIDVVPGFEVVLVLPAVEEGQGGGPLDAFVLAQVVELVLVGGHVVGCGVLSVVRCGSVSALS